jgi:hypothetical protein
VSIHAATDQASCPIDWRLVLPESWDADTARRRAAHLPEAVGHRPNWQLVLDLLDELGGWGLAPPVVVADAGYGTRASWASGWRGAGWPTWSRSRPPPGPIRRRWPSRSPRTPGGGVVLARATALSGPRWPSWSRRPARRRSRPSPGPRDPRQAALAVCGPGGRSGRGEAAPRRRRRGATGALAAGRVAPDQPQPVKYWLASLPEDTPLQELVRLAKLRWRVEHDYRELKDGLGLDHFEGRSFGGWHHHLTLVSAAHAVVTLQRLDPNQPRRPDHLPGIA